MAEALASPRDFVSLQKKIFARYVQQQFKAAGRKLDPIKDIVEDCKSGVLLLNLAEVLSGTEVPAKKPKEGKEPNKFEVQALVKTTLDHLQDKVLTHTKLTVSMENVMDGNEQQVLGLIFQLILKSLKFDDDPDAAAQNDAKEALLLWANNRVNGYRGIDKIKNFTKDWHTGLPFLALLHKMRPKLVDYDSFNAQDKLGNMRKALELGESVANIEKFLEAEDVLKLDEISGIVYIYEWYQAISFLARQDIAARRVGQLIDLTVLHDGMRAEYKAGSEKLNSWSNDKIAQLNDRNFGSAPEGEGRLAEVEALLTQFYDYKKGEKTEQLAVSLDLEALFDDLAVRLVNAKRPAYAPELPPSAIEKKFEEVDQAELERAKALHAERERQNKIIDDRISKEFADAVDAFNGWLNGLKQEQKGSKDEELEKQLSTLEGIKGRLGEYEAHAATLATKQEAVNGRNISNNPFTVSTPEDCAALVSQFTQVIEKKITMVQEQIANKEKGGLTEEQEAEVLANFKYFDTDASGKLVKKELRACMQSLGVEFSPQVVDEVLKKYDTTGDGQLEFAEFKHYMATILGDAQGSEDIESGFYLIAMEKDETNVTQGQLAALENGLSWKEKHITYLTSGNPDVPMDGDKFDYKKWTAAVFAR